MKWIKVNNCVGEEIFINLEKIAHIKARIFKKDGDYSSIGNTGVEVNLSVVDEDGNGYSIYMYLSEWEKIKELMFV